MLIQQHIHLQRILGENVLKLRNGLVSGFPGGGADAGGRGLHVQVHLHSLHGSPTPPTGRPQKDSSCPVERCPLGVEDREEPELCCCCSDPVLDAAVDEDVDEERVFSLKSVMMTVTLPTVTASCWAVLRSTFFSLGLRGMETEREAPDGMY